MQARLSLDSLGELDGGNGRLIIDAAIAKAVADLDDRGEDGKPREVNIKLVLKKIGIDGDMCVANVEANAKVPSYAINGTLCRPKVSNGQSLLLFQQLAPDNPDQRTIDERLAEGEIPPGM